MDPQELMREAQLLFVDGKVKESIKAFTKAIEAGANPYIAHLSRLYLFQIFQLLYRK
jgi:hypothetical protein